MYQCLQDHTLLGASLWQKDALLWGLQMFFCWSYIKVLSSTLGLKSAVHSIPRMGNPINGCTVSKFELSTPEYHKALYLLLTWNTAKLVQRGTRMVLVLIYYKYWYQIHCLSEMNYIYTVLSCWGNHSVSFSQHLAIWDNWIWGNTIFKKIYLGVHSDFPSSNEMQHTW